MHCYMHTTTYIVHSMHDIIIHTNSILLYALYILGTHASFINILHVIKHCFASSLFNTLKPSSNRSNQFTVVLKTDEICCNCVFCNLIGLQISEAGTKHNIGMRPDPRCVWLRQTRAWPETSREAPSIGIKC